MVLEGGSIDVNGCGSILSTEECLLSPIQERNPGLSRSRLEEMCPPILAPDTHSG